MSTYDGLNLPQLLDRMHELVMPEPVAWLPQTPGWWIVLGWMLAVLLLLAWQFARRRRRNRYRRDALAKLKAVSATSELGPAESAQHIAALLKRTALAAYPPKTPISRHALLSFAACKLKIICIQRTTG